MSELLLVIIIGLGFLSGLVLASIIANGFNSRAW